MKLENIYDIIVIGGGAAGFFAALTAKSLNPKLKVCIIEKANKLLSKVKVSGGGRCNITHHCFEPSELVKNYPRGSKELLSPFFTFQPKNMIHWLSERGVKLHTEADGRMFPITNDSQTIIDCFFNEAKKLSIDIFKLTKIQKIEKKEAYFVLETSSLTYTATKLILATGSSSAGYLWAKELGHTVKTPVPSLFTFNIPSFDLAESTGVSVSDVEVSIETLKHKQKGPILITHFGFSGPAILKLSAWAARELFEKNYQFKLMLNWLPASNAEKSYKHLLDLKEKSSHKMLKNELPFSLPKNLWVKLIEKASISINSKLFSTSNKSLKNLSELIHKDFYLVSGKTTHKDEFVTSGGIALSEVNFKSMESKVCPNLYFAGEILDIDGITGGFNFQNAWTTGYIAGKNFSF